MSAISTYEKIDWRQKSRSKHYTSATILVLSSGLAEWTILSTHADIVRSYSLQFKEKLCIFEIRLHV